MNRVGPWGAIRMATQADETASPAAAAPVSRRLCDLARRGGLVAAAIAALIGVLALVGWATVTEVLIAGPGGEVPVKPNTAVGLTAAGAAVWLLSAGGASRPARLAGRVVALLVAALAAASLLQYHAAIELGIDQVLFSDAVADFGQAPLGRMPPDTAAGLLLLGIGLAVADLRWGRGWPSQLCALGVGVIGLVGLGAVLTGGPDVYGPDSFAMAVPSAVAIMLLSLSLLGLRPERGLMRQVFTLSPGGALARRLMPFAVFFPPLLALLRWLGQDFGWYSVPVGVLLMVVLLAIIGTAVIWLAARWVDRADAERRQASAEIDEFFDISVELLCIVDTEGHYKRLNPAWEVVLGRPPAELRSRSFLELVHPDDAERTVAELQRLTTAKRKLHNFENRYLRSDGQYRWLLWNAASAPEQGLVYATARDITDQKESERVLAEARDVAVQAVEAKSQFLAVMSHEIRTPMNGVIGLTGLLLDTQLTDVQRGYAEGIRTAGHSLLTVINDILDFSKLEADKIVLEEVDFDLRQLVEEVCAVLATTAQAKGLELVGWCHPELPRGVRGDPGRLRQILLNLGGNAVKFTDDGEVVVEARPAPAGALDGQPADPAVLPVTIEVRDTGMGIADADRERLFGSFVQADSSTTRRHGGTGLGLAISRRLAERMAGALTLTSELGGGSSFRVTVPLLRQEQPAPPGAPPRQLAGQRVLIVDDNATNRLVLTHQLRSWRLRPQPTPDGPHAIAELRRAATAGAPYDLVLLDHQMPVMSGLEVARVIVNSPEIPTVPMALLSSAGDVDPADTAAVGIEVTLTKPVRESVLYDSLLRLVGKSQAEAEPAEPVERAEPAEPVTADGPAAADSTAGPRLLLVEDNEINQAVAVGVLRKLGYRIDIANDGVEALERLAEHSYPAVLMDLQMPRMDGYQATAEFRRREPPGSHTPVIAMTAAALAGDRDRSLAAGMDDHVTKPIDPAEVDRVLRQWLTTSPAAGGDGAGPDPGADPDPATQVRQRLVELFDSPAPENPLADRVLRSFLARGPELREELVGAVSRGDQDEVWRLAHTLLGAAGNVGAGSLAGVASDLQDAASARDLSREQELLSRLTAELTTAEAAVEQVLSGQ
ncbi:response regulator [Natronosporangium hydrolyticum]|uniref:Circadian input-output histidine kinase CikA n=1 Tax=Natronosporangium hydrolyticum TaxID=2811111 RepID=A0A895Y5Y6_9ACTN|nr:response regulator [Natronosporangium hydrolyticum]QSB12801.1 response regulator [Natronosporangium hydrolyticum]